MEPDLLHKILLWCMPLFGVVGLLFALYKAKFIMKQDPGTPRMQEISGFIAEGAMAFIRREYKTVAVFMIFLSVVIAIMNYMSSEVDKWWMALTAFSFLFGAFNSMLAGYLGMKVATRANVRASAAARQGLNPALAVAFSGGTVMGMCVVGLGVLGLGILLALFFFLLRAPGVIEGDPLVTAVAMITGFSMGASAVALFARVGGGIYTKGADVGADLVGKVEKGIPEDDPRNPAVIADLVGDNVGDVAGMGADLFESYVESIHASMVIAAAAFFMDVFYKSINPNARLQIVMLPLLLCGIGVVVSIIGSFMVRTTEGSDPQKALNLGTYTAIGLMIASTFAVCFWMYPDEKMWWRPAVSFMLGLVAGAVIGIVTEYFTSESKPPVRGIANASQTGPATTIIEGLAVGMQSTWMPVVFLAFAAVGAYMVCMPLGGSVTKEVYETMSKAAIEKPYLLNTEVVKTFSQAIGSFASNMGLYGISMAGLGMLSVTGIILAVDAYGPVADNAGGISEMADLPKEVRGRTDKLDAVGNTTAAIGKGFAIGSAALTALALFAAVNVACGHYKIPLNLNIMDPFVIGGLLMGAMLPFLFSSMTMRAVGRTAFNMVQEVRRQFKEIPGLMEGTGKPDYAQCVDISTGAAIHEMIKPGVLAVIIPVVVGCININMLGGLLAGVTVAGVSMAIFQANSGGAWDNAKKYIESGNLGGKGSDAHKAAVVGDTVGDPFKDTSGPAMNILIKLMSISSLIFVPLFAVTNKRAAGPETKAAANITESQTAMVQPGEMESLRDATVKTPDGSAQVTISGLNQTNNNADITARRSAAARRSRYSLQRIQR